MMSRMRRRVLVILSAVSLLLCVATAVLWVRSYWVRDIVGFGVAEGNGHVVQSILGRLHVLSSLDGGYAGGVSYSSDWLSPQAVWHGGMSHYPLAIHWRLGCACETYTRYSMGYGFGSPGVTTHHRLIVVPYAYPAAAFAVGPAILIFRRWRRGRCAAAGMCRTCGYDLRATPERCPECGTAAAADLVSAPGPKCGEVLGHRPDGGFRG